MFHTVPPLFFSCPLLPEIFHFSVFPPPFLASSLCSDFFSFTHPIGHFIYTAPVDLLICGLYADSVHPLESGIRMDRTFRRELYRGHMQAVISLLSPSCSKHTVQTLISFTWVRESTLLLLRSQLWCMAG